MIKTINEQKVNVNPNLERKKTNYTLRRLAAGLTVVGTIFTIAACDQKKVPDFDFNQNSNTSLSDQYQKQYEVEFSPEEELLANKMEVYDITRDQYENLNNNDKASELEKVDTRIDLVEQTRIINNVCLDSIKLKVKEAVGIENADIQINRTFDKGNGKFFYKIDVNKDGRTLYSFTQNEIPNEIKYLIDKIGTLQEYHGDGKNQVWNKDIDSFNKLGTTIYNETLSFLDNDYEYDGTNLKEITKEQEKAR